MKKAAVPSILVAVVLLAVAVIAEAQQPKKVPRIGFLSAFSSSSDRSASKHSARACENWATSRDRTSSLSGDLRKERSIRSHVMLLSWSVSR